MTRLLKTARRAWRRLAAALRSSRREREMADEIESHLALLTEENQRAGMTAAEASRAARLTFGSLEAVKESYRDERGLPWIESLFTDMRYALRGLCKSPGFTLTAIGALAVGIGSTTAVFSIVNVLLLKPLPFADPERLVMLTVTDGEGGWNPVASPAIFNHLREQTGVLKDVSAFVSDDAVMNYTGGDVVEQWRTFRVSSGLFNCTGLRFLLGRPFSAEEDLPNSARVAVLGQSLWERRFAKDPAVVGKAVALNGIAYTVVGVVAENAGLREFGAIPEVYVPMRLDPNSGDLGGYFMAMARLQPGVTAEQAKSRLQASAGAYRAKFPGGLDAKGGFDAVPFREFLTGQLRALLLVLLGAVGLVLLIACANVANLLLARAAVRRREFGIRAAIGAGRGRIVRQLLTESVLLALAGGTLGLMLGYGGIRALLTANTADFPLMGENGETVLLDWRVAAFVFAVSLVTAVVFGLFSALRSSRVDLNSFLKDGGKGAGMRQSRARAALVVSEVTLAVVLLVGSALLIRSFAALYKVDRGFETKNVMTMQTLLGGPKYATSAGVAETIRIGLEQLRSIPGVAAASAGAQVPLQGTSDLPFDIAGRRSDSGQADSPGPAGWATVSPGYFEAFKIPVKRGREFDDRDTGGAPAVVVINETMAKLFWKDGDPLNARIKIGRDVMKELKEEPVRQIVGVVADVRDTGLQNAPRPVMYIPQAQVPDAFTAAFGRDDFMKWVVRTRDDPRKLAPLIQEKLRQATGLPVSDFMMMDHVVALSVARQRFSLLLMGVFGGAALLLAAMGIYGLMAYTVEQRTHEIGIRLALGANAAEVRRMVVRQGMRLALTGAGLGMGASWVLARTLESLLYGVKVHDPLVFLAVPAVLSAVALYAVWVPALRSSRVDPLTALRYE